jgi:hypothetical protein
MSTIKLLFLFFLLFPAILSAQSGPVLKIDGGENINTGNHPKDKEVNYDILFKNSGDSDLKIISVVPTCGCSSALSSDSIIKPGEAGSIKFTFNGHGFGSVTKNLIVNTNESADNYHTLHITMNMVDPLGLNPQSIITEGKVGDNLTKTATVTNSTDKQIDIDVSSNSPAVKVTSDKTSLQPNESASLNIDIKIYEDSAVNAAVIVKTGDSEVQIPILVDVKKK